MPALVRTGKRSPRGPNGRLPMTPGDIDAMRWVPAGLLVMALLGCDGHITRVEDEEVGSAPQLSSAAGISQAAHCPACVLGPKVYTRDQGTPKTERTTFPGDPAADYVIDLDDNGSQGADGAVWLNGELLLAPRTSADLGPRHIRRAVQLAAANTLEVRLVGKPASTLTVSLLGGVEKIGPGGGTVTAPGGAARVTVPPGALGSPVEIAVVVVDDPTAATTTQIKRVTLLPEGTVFAVPVELAVTLDQPLEATAGLYLKEGAWLTWGPTQVDPSTSTLRIDTPHFSTFVARQRFGLPGFGLYSTGFVGGEVPVAPRPSTNMPLSPAALDAALAKVLDLWRPALASHGIAVAATTTSLPDIEIGFTDLRTSHPLVLGVAKVEDFGYRHRIELERNVVWEPFADNWDPILTGPWLVLEVLAHEFGHVFDLKHSGSGGSSSLMSSTAANKPWALADAEVAGLRAAYASPPGHPSYGAPVKLVPVSPTSVNAPGGFVGASDLPTVRAIDAAGRPVEGVPVKFLALPPSSSYAVSNTGLTRADGTLSVGSWEITGGSTALIVARAYLPSANAAADESVTFVATVPADSADWTGFVRFSPGSWSATVGQSSCANVPSYPAPLPGYLARDTLHFTAEGSRPGLYFRWWGHVGWVVSKVPDRSSSFADNIPLPVSGTVVFCGLPNRWPGWPTWPPPPLWDGGIPGAEHYWLRYQILDGPLWFATVLQEDSLLVRMKYRY
jgi:hypothetical protein